MHHMTRAKRKRDAATAADLFNARHPVGVPVRFWPGFKDGPGRVSNTRSTAWVMGESDPVVSVVGYPGGIALTHIEVSIPAMAAR